MSLTSEITAELGKRIKTARRARGLTQAQLAGSEYSVAFVSRIEAGERTPSPEALAVFSRRLGTSPGSLLSPIDESLLVDLEQTKVSLQRAYGASDFATTKVEAERLLRFAERAAAPSYEAFALRYIGEATFSLGDAEGAIEWFQRALAADLDGSLEDRLDLSVSIARSYRALGDLGHSADLLQRAMEQLGDVVTLNPVLAARICTQLAATCYDRGDLMRAREVSAEAIRHAQAAADRRTLANALWVAAPPMAAADPARALSLIRRAGTLYAELGNMVQLGRLYGMLGHLATQVGDRAGARAALERAMPLVEESGNPPDRAKVRDNLADLELVEGNLDEALRLTDEALGMLEETEPLERAQAHRTRGQALVARNPEAAERELRAAVELFISVGAQTEAARCFRSLGDLLVAQGRNDEALAIFREGLGAVEGAA